MRATVLSTLAIVVLTLSDAALTFKPTRGAPQGRNVFSRFANSRFPFFTVDLARFQDRVPASGRKRSMDLHDNVNADSELNDNVIDLVGTEKDLPNDIAEAVGIFDAKHIGNVDYITEEFSGFEDAPKGAAMPSIDKRSELRKRIHTCAFMRRLGVPIGLCFSNLRRLKEENKNKIQAQRQQKNPYEYLERQLQGHTMLGGGVGRR